MDIEIELIFIPRTVVAEVQVNIQNCRIWLWLLAKVPQGAHAAKRYSLPRGVDIQLMFALRSAVFEIWLIVKIATFGHET